MTDDRKRNTGGEVEPEELWLPTHVMQYYTVEQYAEQSRALAESRAEVEALRASMVGDAANHVAIERDRHKARAERLAEALREAMEWNWLDDDARPSRIAELCDAALNLEPTP